MLSEAQRACPYWQLDGKDVQIENHFQIMQQTKPWMQPPDCGRWFLCMPWELGRRSIHRFLERRQGGRRTKASARNCMYVYMYADRSKKSYQRHVRSARSQLTPSFIAA